jgi:hypothetical protein
MKTYGLSQSFALPIHMKFSISLLKNISYKELIFDKWKKKKHRFENLITKALTKIYLWIFEWPKLGPYFQKSLHGSFFVGLMIFLLVKCM